MNHAVKPELGNGSGNDGLNAAQNLEVKKLAEVEVEKSEDRVLRAIADLKGDLNKRLDRMDQRMDERFDRMDDRLDSLKTGVNIVQGAMGLNLVLTGYILWMMKGLLAA